MTGFSKAIAVGACMIGAAQAFSPSNAGVFAVRNAPVSASSSFCPSLRQRQSDSAHPRRGDTVAVSMNLGERFVRLVKANVNELLTKNEDPEKMLNQIVEDMQVPLAASPPFSPRHITRIANVPPSDLRRRHS